MDGAGHGLRGVDLAEVVLGGGWVTFGPLGDAVFQ